MPTIFFTISRIFIYHSHLYKMNHLFSVLSGYLSYQIKILFKSLSYHCYLRLQRIATNTALTLYYISDSKITP